MCGSLRVNVCLSRLSGSVCVARCLPWGFVVVVGGLLAAQTTKKEVSLFLFFYRLVCVQSQSMFHSIFTDKQVFHDKIRGTQFPVGLHECMFFGAGCVDISVCFVCFELRMCV